METKEIEIQGKKGKFKVSIKIRDFFNENQQKLIKLPQNFLITIEFQMFPLQNGAHFRIYPIPFK